MGKNNSHDVRELYGKHPGDIYIIGSGATMNHFNPEFFKGKIVIGLNNAHKDFPCTYMLTHHHEIVQDAINSGQTVITSKHNICFPGAPEHNFMGEYYFYEHTQQGYCTVDLKEFGKIIIAAGTPVVAALQIAHQMGAKNILLCGVDGGTIDDKLNYDKYHPKTQNGHPGRVQGVINTIANRIREEGVGVCSVLPWVNLTLEGHKFKAT